MRPRASTGLATPAHLNRLELPYDPAQQLVASFENVMLARQNRPYERTTCIWHASDVRDLRRHPGGSQSTFSGAAVDCLPVSEEDVAALEVGNIQFPLLPAQNIVQRPLAGRLLLNTPARVAQYRTESDSGFQRDDMEEYNNAHRG